MRSRISVAVLLVVLSIACRGRAPEPGASPDAALADRLEKLPTLPAEIAATLDPKTNMTKMTAGVPPEPVKLTGTLPHAPCCSIKDQKHLKVRVALTKCGPLRDFVLAPISDLVMAREGGGQGGGGEVSGADHSGGSGSKISAYKLNTVNRGNVWATMICVTSEGPWDATFIEERHCTNYSPQDSLLVSAWGTLYGYYWNGGTTNHPPEVAVVSCDVTGTIRFPCGISNCDCASNTCPPGQQGPCAPPW